MRIVAPLLVVLLFAPFATASDIAVPVQLHETAAGFHVIPEQVNANVGDTITMTIENQGESPHNFMICGDGTNNNADCNDRWAFTGMIQANDTATMTFTVPNAGTFDYYCYIAGHKLGGMRGKLVVQGDAPKSGIPDVGLLGVAGVALAAMLVARRQR